MPRPNLLFITTDQQRWDSLPCYGLDFMQTPNQHLSFSASSCALSAASHIPFASRICLGLLHSGSNNSGLATRRQAHNARLPAFGFCGRPFPR